MQAKQSKCFLKKIFCPKDCFSISTIIVIQWMDNILPSKSCDIRNLVVLKLILLQQCLTNLKLTVGSYARHYP